jgi:hypothetical protein
VGDDQFPTGTAPTLPEPSYTPGFPYGPVEFPTPSTTPAPGVEDIPSPTTCPTGQAPNSAGQCVPIQQLPDCAAGYARNTTTGLCEPLPFNAGQGDITSVQVPATVVRGNSFLITTWFKNTVLTPLQYVVRVTIGALGLDYTAPALSVEAGQTAKVETTLVVPANTPAGSYQGTVSLRAYSPANILVNQDSEPFTLVVTTQTGTTPTAVITLSKTTVQAGGTFSVTCAGFGPGETIDFIAKIGSTVIAVDEKAADSSGAVVLNTLDIYTTAPTGTATVVATGRTTFRVATATIAITAATPTPTPTTCPTGQHLENGVCVPDTTYTGTTSLNKTTYVLGETITASGTGFAPGENIEVRLYIPNDVSVYAVPLFTASATGTWSTTLPANTVGTGHVHMKGQTSQVHLDKNLTITAAPTPTPTPTTANIAPSAASVQQGASISVVCTNFAASEVVNFIAKVGTTTVATDSKTMLTNGSNTLNTLTFATSSPLGTAVITATGVTSGKTATASVTVTAGPTPTPTPTPTAVVATDKATYTIGETMSCLGTGLQAGEPCYFSLTIDSVERYRTTDRNADSTGRVTGVLLANTIGGGHAHVTGKTSGRTAAVSVSIVAAPAPTPTPTPTASITLSGSVVKKGNSISIITTGFGAGEVVDYKAVIGSTIVATDSKTMLATGSNTLNTLTFSTTSPSGLATVTAKGRTTLRVATKTITVYMDTAVAGISLTTNKSTYTKGETISLTGVGFLANEKVKVWETISGSSVYNSPDLQASSTGTIGGSLPTPVAGGGHVNAIGRTSGRWANRGITVV